ncbi:MAG TPA: hypothetical protein VEC56_02990, partial [Candidatus Krumholzibacteria bacterium]|nr:hypothetical protein [Candidatus Krumholzibacteria bacterium]
MDLTTACVKTLTSPRAFRAAALALGAAAIFVGQNAGAAKDVFPYPATTRSLDNGLKVVLVPFDSPGIVAYYTIGRAGSRNEVEPGKSGFAHFFEHM